MVCNYDHCCRTVTTDGIGDGTVAPSATTEQTMEEAGDVTVEPENSTAGYSVSFDE